MPAPYRNLVAWQRADDLFVEIHKLTRQKLPRFEQFELGRQIRRAAYRFPANIAEGNSRQHPNDAAHFFNIAVASLAEAGYGLHAAERPGYLVPEDVARLESSIRRTLAPLQGLIKSRRRLATAGTRA
ncbi:MAG: four helix bundle protein [Vicinamibacterales bacterium]